MEHLSADDDGVQFNISELIGDGNDAGDDLMAFMEDALSEESSENMFDSDVDTELPLLFLNDAELTMLIDELKSTHTAKSMLFSAKEELFFYNSVLWQRFYNQEKGNVESCLINRLTQLSSRTKKLTELGYQLFMSFTNECEHRRDKSAMYLLCSEFIKISRKFRYSPSFVNTIPTLVRQLFTDKVQVAMTEEELESLFYVSGWTIHALSKASRRRLAKVSFALSQLVDHDTLDVDNINDQGVLPTNKVDRISHFGGLRYSSKEYFLFIQKFERVFRHMLSEKNLMIFGSFLIDKI